MISISPAKISEHHEGTSVVGGREGSSLTSVSVAPSKKSTFSVLLDEYKRQSKEVSSRDGASQQCKTSSTAKASSSPHDAGGDQSDDIKPSDDVSADMTTSSAARQEAQNKTHAHDSSEQVGDTSSQSDKDDMSKRTEASDDSQSDQAWAFLSSMFDQPMLAQMSQAHASHDVSAHDSSPSSQNGEVVLPAEMATQAGDNRGLPDAMKKVSQPSVESDKVLASMVKAGSLPAEQKDVDASVASSTLPMEGEPHQVSVAAQAQSIDDTHSVAVPSFSGVQTGSASPIVLPGNVQVSGLSVTRGLSSALSEHAEAAHPQEINVDGASYLNVKAEALYTTPSTQASATAEQNLSEPSDVTHQDSENGVSEKKDQEGLGLSALDTAHSSSVNAPQNTSSQNALSDDSRHERQNNQDAFLASNEPRQEGQVKVDNASSSGISTAFQAMISAGEGHHSEGMTAQKADTGALARTDEGDTEVETHSSSAALAQKQVSDSSSKLEMTVKTADATSVKVQVTRLPDGVAEVALQGTDDATTKALTKSHHELLEQLNAAGIHSTSVKIEVLPAELGGMNGDQAQDHLGQNPSFGGQFGQGGGASQEEHRQNYGGFGSVVSSRDEDVGPVVGAENIVSHRRTLPAASSGSLNISV